ncbi:MAG: type II secretion system protein GspG, partial [Opitutales bacterium]|nr:type II secretion system protein GspG [Opitutales bacterium]
MKRNSGFSLIENLCILGVILILSVVFFRTYIHRSNDIKYQSAREELALLNCALEHYNNACGTYPLGNFQSTSENAASLYNALLKKSKNFLNGHNWTLSNDMLIDPWGRPYVYKYSGNPEDTYVLFSVGPNGHMDTRELIDDIYS